MNARNPWIPRTVRVSSLLLALGLLSCLWAVVCPQAVEAANAPSGRGQVSLNGPMGVSVGAWQGSLSYTRSDLTFGCGDCAVPLGFPLSFSGQDAFERSALGFYGWRSPYDVYYVAEDRSRDVSLSGYVTFYWSMASAVRFYPTPEGGFASPPGVDDTLTSPQPGQYVLTTCSGLTYYFDSDRVPRPTRIEARNGQALVLSYNASGYVASIRDSYGRQVLLAYDGQGYLSQVTDPGATPPRTVQYSHDAAGNLTAVVDAVGNATYYSYDEQHRLTEIRDARGNTLRIVYNANGKVASLVTPLSARSFSYDLARQQTAVVDMVSGTESRRTIFHYDDRGRIVERERNDGLKLSVVWDDDDNPVRVTDEMGEVTSYTYDAEHNITSITDPLSRTLSFSYHPTFNEMTSATDALGRTMTAEYDGKGNAVRVTRPGNRVTTY
jgi:YD repeat-containing protein